MQDVMKVREVDLTREGRWFLDTICHQSRHLGALLQPRDGIIYAEIGDAASEDVIQVIVQNPVSGGAFRWMPIELFTEDVGPRIQKGAFIDDGAHIINEAGRELLKQCENGLEIVWQYDDWITQTEAAAFVDVPLHTIRNAVRDGRLLTWDDLSEPNPQRRTRVHRLDVLERWGA